MTSPRSAVQIGGGAGEALEAGAGVAHREVPPPAQAVVAVGAALAVVGAPGHHVEALGVDVGVVVDHHQVAVAQVDVAGGGPEVVVVVGGELLQAEPVGGGHRVQADAGQDQPGVAVDDHGPEAGVGPDVAGGVLAPDVEPVHPVGQLPRGGGGAGRAGLTGAGGGRCL
jgi:hypothetical protein